MWRCSDPRIVRLEQVEKALDQMPALTQAQMDDVLTPSVNSDRHRPGYMRDYMRKRRAK
jgi:hypothetical protein